uniref:Pre-mRNA splicing Prp18-interacting factor n=1 Tax=Tanacetum cinerariifolium TaxID=118510 RepID=A0A699HLJ9_TANCI|nr:hypothetical protein [Tanacetum cinerariifolium]
MSSFYEFTCYGCGGPSDTHLCYLCTCEHCGNILIYGTCLKCNSGARNSFTYDPIPKAFDEVQSISNPPLQSYYNIYLCQICESNSHYGYECSQRVPLVYEPEPCYNQSFSDNAYTHDLPGVTPLIDHHCCYKCGDSLDDFFCHQCTCEFCGNGAHDGYNCPSHYSVNPSLNIQNELSHHEIFINELIRQKLQNEYAQHFPAIAITFDLPTVEPKDSLRMRDEHFDTILETESDKFIKSSVENLVPSLSESDDLSDSECDVPSCDDFITFSNPLFDADEDFSSSDNESFCDEDISKEIYSNPLFDEEIISMKIDPHYFNVESDLIESLFNHDSSVISSSSKINSLLDEFASELILLKSIPPGINETDCDPEEEIHLIEKLLYDNSSPHPPKEFISKKSDAAIESFSPSPILVEDSDSLMEEIDLSFSSDDSMPPGIEEDDYESERDILILEELLSNDSHSLLENESFHFDIPSSSRPFAKPPDDDSGILNVKMMGDIFEQYVPIPRLLNAQSNPASNQEKSPHLLSHRGIKASQLSSKNPIMIYGRNTPILDVPFFHFYPP